MPFAFFSIPAAARPEVAAELNAFLRSHRVLVSGYVSKATLS